MGSEFILCLDNPAIGDKNVRLYELDVTEFVRPNGKRVLHKVRTLLALRAFFVDNKLQVSMEQIAPGKIAFYCTSMVVNETEELPEMTIFVSATDTTTQTLMELRKSVLLDYNERLAAVQKH